MLGEVPWYLCFCPEITARRRARRARRSEDEESAATDGEQQESLPEDPAQRAPLRRQTTGKSGSITSSGGRADIPLIMISKTESQDRLLDSPPPPAEPEEEQEVARGAQKAEPQQPATPTRIMQAPSEEPPDLE